MEITANKIMELYEQKIAELIRENVLLKAENNLLKERGEVNGETDTVQND